MKTKLFTFVITVLLTVIMSKAQEHLYGTKNLVKYTVAKAQNESTFSEMLPAKPFSKTNGVLLSSSLITYSSTQANLLPEIPPAKKNYAFKNQVMIQSSATDGNSLPKIPASKMNYFDRQLRK